MVGLISAPRHAYDGCGEGAGIGASVGFDVGTCEKSNGDHRRALPESELCAVRCAYAVRRPSMRRRSPMTQAMYRSQERRAVSAPTRSAARLFAGATCDGLTRRLAWFLRRDTHRTAEETAPGTGRSWACSSGCTTCADDKVAKRPHAPRNGPAKFKSICGLRDMRLRRRRVHRRCRGARRRNVRRDLVARHRRRGLREHNVNTWRREAFLAVRRAAFSL